VVSGQRGENGPTILAGSGGLADPQQLWVTDAVAIDLLNREGETNSKETEWGKNGGRSLKRKNGNVAKTHGGSAVR